MAKRLGYDSPIVVDASVCIKWFVNESDSPEATAILESAAPLLAPDLLFAEFSNVMWLKQRNGSLSPDQVRRAIEELVQYFGLFDITPCWALMQVAIELAQKLSHPVYDCFYLALAEGHGIPLITADQRFYRIVRAAIPQSKALLLAELG
jgi:predicted nucleic acid-binding protein